MSMLKATIGLALLVAAMFPAMPVDAACSKSADPEQVVQAQLVAYNAHDVEAFAACYADNVIVTDLSGKHPVVKGIAALKTEYAFLTKVPKAFRVQIVKRIVNGSIVVDHERVLGLPADKGTPESVAVYEVRAGRILNVWFPPAP
jgi:putative hydrolase of HD superfamily